MNEDWLTNGDATWKKDPKDTSCLQSKVVVCVKRANSELLPWSNTLLDNVLDLKLSLVDGYIQIDINFKPTDNHIILYLLRNSAHPVHCFKAIPYGVATRVRRNGYTSKAFEKRSVEYQSYLINRGYNPSQVEQQLIILRKSNLFLGTICLFPILSNLKRSFR